MRWACCEAQLAIYINKKDRNVANEKDNFIMVDGKSSRLHLPRLYKVLLFQQRAVTGYLGCLVDYLCAMVTLHPFFSEKRKAGFDLHLA